MKSGSRGEIVGIPQLLNFVGHGKHFVCPGADAHIFSEVFPADGSRGVHQKFSRAGDVVSLRSAAVMHQVIAPDGIQFGVRKDSEGVARFAAEIAGLFRCVYADGHRSYAGGFEFLQVFLYASQLEVTEGSPVAAIEDQEDCFGTGRIRERS